MRNQLAISTMVLALIAPTDATFGVTVDVVDPMVPPVWAVMERQLLRAHTSACQEFFDKYFDVRGYLLCVERWGGDDGPDDAIENLNHWPLLYALGGSEEILRMTRKGWEGHLRQYTEAKTVDVPFARDGMYYKEFPVTMDWLHNGEGLTVFNVLGLADPSPYEFHRRVRRFAGFYLNEEPGAPNYDPEHKIIRSLFNGSRGPLMRKATGLDWAGDPIEVAGRFDPLHGEESYEQMVEHFKDYNDIVGDHPQNLVATSLAANAYMLTHEPKYKEWLIEYVDAWCERTQENGGVIPSNIGLDGSIGGATDGKWYGGVYGWGFTVAVPGSDETANRNTVHLGRIGFGNATLLTGDRKYADVWRNIIKTINAQAKTIDGKTMYPTMYGDDGWYSWSETPWSAGARDVYYWSMDPTDRGLVSRDGWFRFLAGDDPEFPVRALQSDFETIRRKNAAMRSDTTTPDTRLADDPMDKNPVTVDHLLKLMLGALETPSGGALLHARLRYFDPVARRSGLPEDVAALVERMTDRETVVTVVNVNPTDSRELVVQGGAYGEHQIRTVTFNNGRITADAPTFHLRLAPGAGVQLTLQMDRYANEPSLVQPWDRRE